MASINDHVLAQIYNSSEDEDDSGKENKLDPTALNFFEQDSQYPSPFDFIKDIVDGNQDNIKHNMYESQFPLAVAAFDTSSDFMNTGFEVNSQDLYGGGLAISGLYDSQNHNIRPSMFDENGTKNDKNVLQVPVGIDYIERLKAGDSASNYDGMFFNETVCFTDYKGEYGFDVLPKDDKKKFIYSEVLNKCFLTTATHEFHFQLDFNKIPADEILMLRTSLAFGQPEHQMSPVLKCNNCETTQNKLDEANSFIVRAAQNDTTVRYYKSMETGRDYLFHRITTPQPGSLTMSKSLVFTCLSSCKGADSRGINRRDVSIIFTLLDKRHVVVGRRVIKLRICSAPVRDFKIEMKSKEKSETRKRGNRNKPNLPMENSFTSTVQAADTESPKPEASSALVPWEGIKINTEVSSSQETTYSGDEDFGRRKKVCLRSLIRDSHTILRWNRSTRQPRRGFAKNLFNCLRLAQSIIENAKESEKLNGTA